MTPLGTCAVWILLSQADNVIQKEGERNSEGTVRFRLWAPGMWALEKSPHPFWLQFPQRRNNGFGQETCNIIPCVTFWEIMSQNSDGVRLRESSPVKFQFLGGSLKRGHDCGQMLDVFQGSQREAMLYCFREDGLMKNMNCLLCAFFLMIQYEQIHCKLFLKHSTSL